MKLIVNNLETAPLSCLKKLKTVEADLEIAKRVVNNDKQSVHYFLGEFSIPFLDYIGREIMKEEGCYINGILCFYTDVSSQYYEFIGAKFIDKKPTWHKVTLYKGIKNKGEKFADDVKDKGEKIGDDIKNKSEQLRNKGEDLKNKVVDFSNETVEKGKNLIK